jgi:hypothetical protein
VGRHERAHASDELATLDAPSPGSTSSEARAEPTGQARSSDAPTRVDGPRLEPAPERDAAPTEAASLSGRTLGTKTLTKRRAALDLLVGTSDALFDGTSEPAPGTLASTRTGSMVSPRDTLHLEEVRRTRAFTTISLPLALVVLGVLPLVAGDPRAKRVVAAGMVLIALAALVLRWALRRDDGYSVGRALAFGFTCIVGGYAGIYFFGVFSPAVTVIPFGLYFFSVGQSTRGTLAIWLASAALHALVAGSVMLGLLPDVGLVRATGAGLAEKAIITLLVEVVFFATFLVARAGRRGMLRSIEQHDQALRGLAQREALLKEARQELARALEAGGYGRFSDEVLGSFRLGRVLGRGGMGEVYEAVHVTTQEPAAVKLLLVPALAEPEHVRRFMREARVISSLASPHVVRVLEVGGLDAPVPFIAMERLRGEDLAEVLRERGKLPFAEVLTLVSEVAKGLEVAHAAGVVHRDVKPRNLFLHQPPGLRPAWKVLDFGVARLEDDDGSTLTRDKMVGTPSYMAPEQAASGTLDRRADVHALGVIAYRTITGRPAFQGDTVPETVYRVVHTMPPRPTKLVRAPAELDLALVVALAKDPAERYASVTELATALAGALRGELSDELRRRAQTLEKRQPWAA